MRVFNKFKGTQGFLYVANRGIRFRYMITKEAQQRAKILAFWKKHGLSPTQEAFGVAERTLYAWQQKLQAHHGKLEALNNQSRAPQHVRRRR